MELQPRGSRLIAAGTVLAALGAGLAVAGLSVGDLPGALAQMTGSADVLPAGGAGGAGGELPSSATGGDGVAGGVLAFTGFAALPLLGVGLLILTAGALLRRNGSR
jgi:hypothetical protein